MNNVKKISINSIELYNENPRHERAKNESDALKKLIKMVGNQYMLNLIVDIIEKGLVESNLPIVVYNENRKKYVVYEGNRRLASLKIINNPEILDNIDQKLKKQVILALKKVKAKRYFNLNCYVTDENTALNYMEAIHSGENKGRGLKPWSPREKQIFDKRKNDKLSVELIITEQTQKYLKIDITDKINYTTLNRLFNNKRVKSALGIKEISPKYFEKENIKKINYLVDEVVRESKKQNKALTRLFNKAEEIEKFLIPLIENYGKRNIKPGEMVDNKDSSNIIIEKNDEKTRFNDIKSTKESNKNSENIKKPIFYVLKNNISFYENENYDLRKLFNLPNEKLKNLKILDKNGLNISDFVIKRCNYPSNYNVKFQYLNEEVLEISIKVKKINFDTKPLSKNLLPRNFYNNYYRRIEFNGSEKIDSLIKFLCSYNIYGEYQYLMNILSRSFLEFTFKSYVCFIEQWSNKEIEQKDQNFEGFINSVCAIIENKDKSKFAKKVIVGRREVTKKLITLQKSIHYYDVSISVDDLKTVFSNLMPYLEYIYDKLLTINNKKVNL